MYRKGVAGGGWADDSEDEDTPFHVEKQALETDICATSEDKESLAEQLVSLETSWELTALQNFIDEFSDNSVFQNLRSFYASR